MKAIAAIMLMTAVVFTAGCTKPKSSSGSYNGHDYVDLGLPSGTLWATCNVGANTPEDYGDYFAWGETTPKDHYDWSTYQYCMGSQNTLTKYCNNSNYGYNGFTDNLTTLLPEDDAATANWGSGWRMPTKEEWQELLNNTTVTWTTQNGVSGRLFTASNGNSLFLPAAGTHGAPGFNNLHYVGISADYWSRSIHSNQIDAWGHYFSSDYCHVDHDNRKYGHSVRAVCSDNGGNNGGLDNGTLKGTTWQLDNPHDEGFANYGDYRVIYTVAFGQDNDVTFTRQISCEEINYYQKPVMTGTYAYSNGSGVAMIHNEGETTDYRITFIVLGDDMLQWNYNLREIILFKQ